ncbi:Multi antimicrobial extrusion protein [Dillenia turbinata]|uniref:Protein DETOXIFICATION n=1 Tax=Dillenia turbinata TaxID=194707 RepID=A0AAN8Z4E9_9MAGN
MENTNQEPLLSIKDEVQTSSNDNNLRASSFTPDKNDMEPINGVGDFFRQFVVETKTSWFLVGSAIFISICQYSIAAITQVFAGHVGSLELAAVAIEHSVIAGIASAILLGLGSALETLCGQAYGAGQVDMLGIHMQRSWIIQNSAAVILCLLYIFATPLLKLIGQTEAISEEAGTFALWMIPQLFAYAFNFPISKFLRAQRKMMAMALISAVALIFHTALSWVLMLKLGWGLVGAAVVLNGSWWFIVIAQLLYIFSGACGGAWSGFSTKAFQNLWDFLKLSLSSSVMICLQMWYLTVLLLAAGYLKNAEVAVDALSVCLNILGWTVMISLGYNAAISVRVSNELGAAHPRRAKFAVMVVIISSLIIAVILALLLIIFRREYPALFSDSSDVQQVVYNLTILLALCIVIHNVQPVLGGAAVGAGWQAYVGYVNIGCYYLFGIPLALIMAFCASWGVTGIWVGLMSGISLQTLILFLMICRTNWNKEVSIAGDRVKQWG